MCIVDPRLAVASNPGERPIIAIAAATPWATTAAAVITTAHVESTISAISPREQVMS